MQITLYKSALCLRCLFAERYLRQLQEEYPQITIETVDILSSPRRTLHSGIRMIPTIAVNDEQRLSMLLPHKETIRSFLTEQGL